MQMRQVLGFIGVLPNSGTGYLIERVIDMPEDRVACCTVGRAVAVNEEALDESQYLYSGNGIQMAPSIIPLDVIIPADHIFMLGGHRSASTGSRYYLRDTWDGRKVRSTAFVPRNKVVEMTMTVVTPLDRLSTFRVPETLARIPEPEREAPAESTIIETPVGC